MTAVRGSYVAAAALSLAGLALRVAPASLPHTGATPPAPFPASRGAAAAPARGATSYAPIVAGNVFSATRSAPRVRFAPRGATLETRSAGTTAPLRPALRLYGITAGSEGIIALIDADPVVPGAELYRIGDLVAGARLVAATDSTVTLAEPSGPLVLRLPPAPRRTP